jgi:hypothetical protein
MSLSLPRVHPALLLVLCLGSAQSPEESGAQDARGPRFVGTPSDAMAEIHRYAADEPERARSIARQLGDDETLAEPLRAEFRFAEGVVHANAGAPGAAVASFLSARALAGPGELRDAATYDQGTAELLVAEALREEAFQARMDPGAAGASGGAAAQDPFARPRAGYLAAKQTLLERLRAGGEATADTRANLELIQRRLRELDELQQQQEQQEQQQQDDQNQQEEQQGEDSQEGDPQQDEGEPGEQEGDQQQEGQDQEGQEGEPDPNAPEQEQTSPDSGELPDVTETPGSDDGRPAERLLSREEVLRLLDTLEALDGEREALAAQLRAVRRVPVDQDW